MVWQVPFHLLYMAWICKLGQGYKTGVRLGFSSGHLLEDPHNYLDKEGRKMVYWKDFHTMNDINEDTVISFLMDAKSLDEEKARVAKSKASISRRLRG